MSAINSLVRRIHRLEDLHHLRSEMELRQELKRELAMEKTRQELAYAAHTDDKKLIDGLFEAGFTASTLPALSLAPIALVAWGSGHVTAEERAIAMQAIYDSDISGNGPAIAKFQSWLDTRPDPNLFYLWANVTTDRMRTLRPGTQDAHADRTLRLANQVALASGGFLGFGVICTGEQALLDSVREVFHQGVA